VKIFITYFFIAQVLGLMGYSVNEKVDSNLHDTNINQPSFIENTNNLNIDFIQVCGSPFNGWSTTSDYIVLLDTFYISKFEITQYQWEIIMGMNPSFFKCDSCPVENVSWEEVQIFIKQLNKVTNKNYRLPTEAEWEYAAIGGIFAGQYKYSGSNNLGQFGWYKGNSEKRTHPVGKKHSNQLGIYDMSGNVWEWCSDWHTLWNLGDNKHINNLTGPKTGKEKVVKGGSWYNNDTKCTVFTRLKCHPGHRSSNIGFRLVLDY
jgi:formylglycine-generating enzyme required for sulfatase activity